MGLLETTKVIFVVLLGIQVVVLALPALMIGSFLLIHLDSDKGE